MPMLQRTCPTTALIFPTIFFTIALEVTVFHTAQGLLQTLPHFINQGQGGYGFGCAGCGTQGHDARIKILIFLYLQCLYSMQQKIRNINNVLLHRPSAYNGQEGSALKRLVHLPATAGLSSGFAACLLHLAVCPSPRAPSARA